MLSCIFLLKIFDPAKNNKKKNCFGENCRDWGRLDKAWRFLILHRHSQKHPGHPMRGSISDSCTSTEHKRRRRREELACECTQLCIQIEADAWRRELETRSVGGAPVMWVKGLTSEQNVLRSGVKPSEWTPACVIDAELWYKDRTQSPSLEQWSKDDNTSYHIRLMPTENKNCRTQDVWSFKRGGKEKKMMRF